MVEHKIVEVRRKSGIIFADESWEAALERTLNEWGRKGWKAIDIDRTQQSADKDPHISAVMVKEE